jgi:TonB family protein
MKTPYAYVLILITLAGAPVLASARTSEQASTDTGTRSSSIPVPTSVVAPDVDGYGAGKTVTAEFVVDPTGRPSGIHIISGSGDRALNAAVTAAVSQWRFRPAEINGTPVSRTVVVPFRFVQGGDPNLFVPDFVRKARPKG